VIASANTLSPCAACFAEGRFRLRMARAMAEAMVACQTCTLCVVLTGLTSVGQVADA